MNISTEDDIRLVLANNLEYLMTLNGLGQKELENRTSSFHKVNQRTISSYLRTDGELGNATILKVQALARAFDLSVSELLNPNLRSKGNRQLETLSLQNTDEEIALVNNIKLDDINFMKGLIKFCIKESAFLLVETNMINQDQAKTIFDLTEDISTTSTLILRHKGIDKTTGKLSNTLKSYIK
ncbi:hypothetical protein Sps_01464 [Shewanella psychrophila]|uniref:Uncharacterized protein n=1 Tax=Shewanella psychrophila TaxID=225848 RepID=A0A1S6HM84_9GAMM|nr:hypothetical protein [Shewanella psychrophila]AQS36630.1 hypothetical protein Sps_01464 [Shewanella psychrophila]